MLAVNMDLFPFFRKNSKGQDFLARDNDGKIYLQGDIIVQKGKEHYGCGSLTRLPMEDEGSTGNIGNHFESRVFGNELMVASAKIGYRLSKFTLAVLEDSGW